MRREPPEAHPPGPPREAASSGEGWTANIGGVVELDLAPRATVPLVGLDVVCWNLAVGTARLDLLLGRLADGAFGSVRTDPARPLVVLAQEAYRTDASVPEHARGATHGGWIVRGGQRDIASVAAEHGLSLRYAPSMRNGAERSDRGNAILSSAAIGRWRHAPLPFLRQHRVAVMAELADLPGVTLVSAHLDTWGRPSGTRWLWRFGGGRAAQAAALASALAGETEGGTVVLGADLNTPLGRRDPAFQTLTRHGFGTAGEVTWRHTFHGPVRFLLDHVLVRPAGPRRIVAVRALRIDEDVADGSARIFGSDHHPLLVRFDVAPDSGPSASSPRSE